MDFSMSQTQQAVAEAAASVFGGYRTGLGKGSTVHDGCDRALWKELAQAGLLGLAVPGWLGGDGLDMADTAVLLTEAGRAAALGATLASLRVNELLNWQVAAAATVDVADASVTKVYSSVQVQQLGQVLEEVVARHGDPAEEETAQLRHWLDIQAKRNVVLTFGGGVNEIQRELIATAGLGLPRVPRGT